MKERRLLPFLLIILAYLVMCFVLLWAFQAHAQPYEEICTREPITLQPGDAVYSQTPPAKQLAACPGASTPSVRFNAEGITAWRYCAGSNVPQIGAVTWQWLRDTPVAAAEIFRLGANPAEADLREAVSRHASQPIDSPLLTPVWCPHWPEIAAGRPDWRVAGSTGFLIRDGRLAAGGPRAPLRAPCNCAAPLVVAGVTYCPWVGAPASAVARCAR